jgi:hypothetical protein
VWSKAGWFVEGLHLVGEILQPIKDKYLNYVLSHFDMIVWVYIIMFPLCKGIVVESYGLFNCNSNSYMLL